MGCKNEGPSKERYKKEKVEKQRQKDKKEHIEKYGNESKSEKNNNEEAK